MVRFLDRSDTYLGKAAGHPGDMLPALIAIAEAYRLDGPALTAAISAS